MKHIKKFEHAQDYNKLHEDGGMIDVCPAVSYIDELQTVRYEEKGGAGTIVMANEDGDRRLLTIDEYRGSIIKDKCDEEGYQVIGIIVIPASHTKNGKARMVPYNVIPFGSGYKWYTDDGDETNDVDIPELKKYEYLSAIANGEMLINGNLPKNQIEIDRDEIISYDNSTLASDYTHVFDAGWVDEDTELLINPYDTQTHYILNISYDLETTCLPSPYLNDGSKNPIYHNEYVVYDGEKVYNALANLDGKGSTKKIIDVFGTDLSAAGECYNFTTFGTKEGDWYLPTIGELGYLFARIKRIEATIRVVYGHGFSPDDFTYGVWSSSQYSDTQAWVYYGDDNSINCSWKNEYRAIIPFCEV